MLQTIPSTELFRALGHSHRRHTLTALTTAETTMTVRDVTTEIVTHNSAAALPDVPAAEFKRTYLSLVHVHLPMLAAADLIEYDPAREVLDGQNLDAIEPLLSLPTDERPSPEPAQ